MIISNQEVAVHLRLVRNLSHYTSGKYHLCLSLLPGHPSAAPATPLTVIEKDHYSGESRSECEEDCIITRTFPLKSGAYVEINEVYLFKLDCPIDSAALPTLTLKCQLVQVDNHEEKVVNCYSGVIAGSLAHEYLEMDFYDNTPCQIVGSIHRCHYRYHFEHMGQTLDLKEFCNKHCKENAIEILDYLSR